ncbi:hypothetical protein [Streptomyces odonnellii]|uniref:hypothetical protein n=1 Tax=Streptomyces odonnellii TaxID=1417980 RepID=UPI000625B928|nr:hypothetical protein [Streptomyces odonnellii]
MDNSEYDQYEAIVRVRKGARFARSRKTAGAHRGMTRDPDTNQVGQAEIFLKKENEPDPVAAYPQGWLESDRHESEARAQERRENAEFFAEVLVQVGLILAEKAAPRVRKWWHEQALPAVKAKWNDRAPPSVKVTWSSVARSRTSDRRAEEDLQGGVTVSGDQRTTMSGAEARKRFTAAVMARIYSDGQLRLLRNARVVDEGEDGPVELGATDDLTPQRIGEHVALMLEADPSLLGKDTLAELEKLVAEIRADGGYVPIPTAEGALPHDDGND